MTTKGLSEAEYLDIVERVQKAMCVEPFRPDVADVVALVGAWRVERGEVDRLVVDNAELSTECDQWQKKVADCWREIEQLRAQLG